MALGDGITRLPACGVPVSTTSVQAQPLAWHEPLGRSRRGLLRGGVTQSVAFLQRGVWSWVCLELCSRMVSHWLLGLTRVRSPFPLNAFRLVAEKKCQGSVRGGMALLVFSAPMSMTMATCRLGLRNI